MVKTVIQSSIYRQATKEDFYGFLNQLLAATFIITTADEMLGCNLYRHELKAKGQAWIKEVSKLLDGFSRVGDADTEAFYQLIDHYTELIKELSTTRPEQVAGIKEIIKQFKADPEGVFKKFDVVVGDTQKSEA